MTDDRDVVGASEPGLVEGPQAAERDQVVAGKDRGAPALEAEQPRGRLLAGVGGERAAVHDRRRARQADALERCLEGVSPAHGGREVERAGDVSDPLMPERREVLDRGIDAGSIVTGDEREGPGVQVAGDEDRRYIGAREVVDGLAVPGGGRDDQALAPAGQKLVDKHSFPLDIVVGVGQQACQPGAPQDALDAADDRRDHWIRQVGHKDSDRARPAGAQAARNRIRPVAERPGRPPHPPCGWRGDASGQRRIQRP